MSDNNVIRIDLDEIKSRKTIILSATDLQLRSIKSLLGLTDNRIESLGNEIYKLSVSSKKVSAPKILEEITFGVATGRSKPTNIQLLDFDNSEKFYEDSRSGKSYKIISDEFSDFRNRELYKGFQLIEHKWRQMIVTTYAAQNKPISKPGRYSKRASDHAISTYELTEFLEQFLYAPASEGYIRRQWQESETKSEDDVIRIMNLKQRDELNFALTVDDLETIRNRRNQCMHFRVITSQEYEEVVPLINEYLKLQSLEEFRKAVAVPFAEILKQTQKSILSIVKGLDLVPTIGTPFQDKFNVPRIAFPAFTTPVFPTSPIFPVMPSGLSGLFRDYEDESKNDDMTEVEESSTDEHEEDEQDPKKGGK